MPENQLMINVSGPDHSGKGHAISAIAHCLENLGCEVTVQCAQTHNANKLVKTDEELAQRLKGVKVVLTEMQTGI